MGRLLDVRLVGITDGSGDLVVNAAMAVVGRLYAVEWIDGDLVDGVDAVISVQSTPSGVAATLLTLTNANDDALYYPRHQVHSAAGAGLTLEGAEIAYDLPLVCGTPRLVVSSGGDTKTGGCILYVLVSD